MTRLITLLAFFCVISTPIHAQIIDEKEMLRRIYEQTTILPTGKGFVKNGALAKNKLFENTLKTELAQTPEALELLSEESKEKISLLLKFLNEHTKLTTEKSAVELFVKIVDDLEIDLLLLEDTLENAQNRELLEQFYKKIEAYCQSEENRTMNAIGG